MNREELLKIAKPILFNTETVKAILDGRKTQFRAVIKDFQYSNPFPKYGLDKAPYFKHGKFKYEVQIEVDEAYEYELMPQYKKGDILYVRETWTYGTIACDFNEVSGTHEEWIEQTVHEELEEKILFYADICDDDFFVYMDREDFPRWRPSIHMPKKYARIFLKVIDIRVERLQDMHWADMIAEGVQNAPQFMHLWNSISKDGFKWNDNPYVFVYEFERITS